MRIPSPHLPQLTAPDAPSSEISAQRGTNLAITSLPEREQRAADYADRVRHKLADIENGSEGERNIKFQDAYTFMEPAGYFSGGLLAAGYNPHEKITVTFNSYTGMGKPDHLSDSNKRTYFAWEIAAGALAHDKVERGGPIHFQSMVIEPKDKRLINDLESIGEKLQDSWKHVIATPMRDASGALAKRSGEADAYVIKGTLHSLRSDIDRFKHLSAEGQEAVSRTLDQHGQIIIPNVYGYPLSGYAFIPYTPYDGDYNRRPNQGLMMDLKNGTVSEINGDNEFAKWANVNRDALVRNFNARDLQGGKDAHWPRAADVLDNLIAGVNAHYPGRQNMFKDKAVPVSELFNYTQSRGEDYQLKFGSLKNGITSKYQDVNAKNAVWSDQTTVFGSSQQNWKAAKEFWGNTFGYVPIVGNAGNIVFGVHDSIYGKTAEDRVGGNAAAVISTLQLAHEVAPTAAEVGLGEAPLKFNTYNGQEYRWRHNPKSSTFEFERAPKAANDEQISEHSPPDHSNETRHRAGAQQTLPDFSAHALPDNFLEGRKLRGDGTYQVGDQFYVRYTDGSGTLKVFEISQNYKVGSGFVRVIDPTTKKTVMFLESAGGGEWRLNTMKGGGKKAIKHATQTKPLEQNNSLPDTSPNKPFGNHHDWQSILDSGTYNGQAVYIHYTDKAGAEAIARGQAITDAARGETRAGSKGGVYVNPPGQQFNSENVEDLLFLGNERYVGRGDYMVIFSTDQVPEELGAITAGSPFVELKMPKEIRLKPANFLYLGPNKFPNYFD